MTSISICFEHAQQANQLCIYVNFQRWHDVGKYSDADPSIVCGIEFTLKTCKFISSRLTLQPNKQIKMQHHILIVLTEKKFKN